MRYPQIGKYCLVLCLIPLLAMGCLRAATLPATYAVSGRVVDQQQQGVAGVSVGFHGGTSGQQVTNEHGEFHLSGLRGPTILYAHLEGWVFGEKMVYNDTENLLVGGERLEHSLEFLANGAGVIYVEGETVFDQAGFAHGIDLFMEAVPEFGWRFSHWDHDAGNTQNPRRLYVTQTTTITAVFVREEYDLLIDIVGSGTVFGNPIAQTHLYESEVVMEAVADFGWAFSHWEGDIWTTENPTEITIYGPQAVTAVFVREGFNLTVDTRGGGTVFPPSNERAYVFEENATLHAVPDAGWAFSHWEGDVAGYTNPITLEMHAHTRVTGVFVPTGVLGTMTASWWKSPRCRFSQSYGELLLRF